MRMALIRGEDVVRELLLLLGQSDTRGDTFADCDAHTSIPVTPAYAAIPLIVASFCKCPQIVH